MAELIVSVDPEELVALEALEVLELMAPVDMEVDLAMEEE